MRISASCVAFAARFEERLELDRDVEVIFDGVLAAAGDEDDVVDARGDRFLDAVLNDRLVDERKHFLGLGFGRRQETGSEAGGGEDGFANAGGHVEDPNRGLAGDANIQSRAEVACWTPSSFATTSTRFAPG